MSAAVVRPRRRAAGRLVLLAALVACGGEAASDAGREEEGARIPLPPGFTDEDGWHVAVAAELGEKVGGCAVGDVDPDRVGDEIVVVTGSGAVHLLSYAQGTWSRELLGRTPGEMVQLAVGDVLPLTPGLEVVAVGIARGREDDGGEGAAWLVSGGEDGWELRELHRSPALLHAVAITELHDAPGDEVVVAGYAQEAVMLVRDGEGWSPAVLGSLGGAAKSAVPYQDGFAVGCTDGSTTVFRLADGQWRQKVVDEAPAGVARLSTDDERLLAARDDGVLALLAADGSAEVYREDDKLRGAVIGNVDPTSRGLELATAGYSGRLTVLLMEDDGWRPVTVFEDTDRLHHLASGTLGTVGAGLFLVTCGYSGRVVVVGRGNP